MGEHLERGANVYAYTRETRDGVGLYALQYADSPAEAPIFEEEIFVELECFIEALTQAIQEGNKIYIADYLEEDAETLDEEGTFWQDLYYDHVTTSAL